MVTTAQTEVQNLFAAKRPPAHQPAPPLIHRSIESFLGNHHASDFRKLRENLSPSSQLEPDPYEERFSR